MLKLIPTSHTFTALLKTVMMAIEISFTIRLMAIILVLSTPANNLSV